MGRHRKAGKGGKRKHSSEGQNEQLKCARNGGSPTQVLDVESVSDTIRDANSVLFDESLINLTGNMDNSVFDACSGNSTAVTDGILQPNAGANNTLSVTGSSQISGSDLSATSVIPEPAISDVMKVLSVINSKLSVVDSKLGKLDILEKKVSNFETEINKIWTFVRDELKSNNVAVSKINEQIESIEFSLGVANDDIHRLKSDGVTAKDTILYLQSQSMRNNLVFTSIHEDMHEKPEQTETKIRQFLVDKLKLAQDYVTSLSLERVHRMGDRSREGPRNIVAKFSYFKDREIVRRARTNLKGTNCFIYEQFPKEIADRRRQQVPQLKRAIQEGRRAWLSYDTLFIDG